MEFSDIMSENPFANYPLEKECLKEWITEGMEGIHIEFKLQISISDTRQKCEYIRDMISLADALHNILFDPGGWDEEFNKLAQMEQ